MRQALESAYADETFVKVLSEGEIPSLADIVNTNSCHIGLVVVNNVVQVVSSLDNLRKGAASQAVQGFNILQGFAEDTGLAAA